MDSGLEGVEVSTNAHHRLALPSRCTVGDILVVPDLDQVVTTTGHKPSLLTGSRVGADQAARKSSGSPADRVHTHPVGMEGLMGPIVVAKFKNTDMAVGGGTGKEAPALMRGPRYHVDGSRVEREIEDFSPCAATNRGGCILGLLPPDQDLAIV